MSQLWFASARGVLLGLICAHLAWSQTPRDPQLDELKAALDSACRQIDALSPNNFGMPSV
jgi:hypothetical protein